MEILCTQNKILASKMQHLQQQKTSVFAPLILKRWIINCWRRDTNGTSGYFCQWKTTTLITRRRRSILVVEMSLSKISRNFFIEMKRLSPLLLNEGNNCCLRALCRFCKEDIFEEAINQTNLKRHTILVIGN